MKIYYTGVDNGDGSRGVEFFYDKESIELLEEIDFERYRGEGGRYFHMPAEAIFQSGLYIRTLEAVKHDCC